MVAPPDELIDLIRRADCPVKPSRLLDAFRRLRGELSGILGAISTAIAGSEVAAVDALLSELPEGWQLYLANSLPIRLVDSALQQILHPVRVGYHRGASGIDGTLAAACGFAHGSATPTVAIVGDLAAIHDVNSLLLVARSKTPVIIVVINNSGGGIFSTLPDIADLDCFEDFFVTPQRVDFAGAAHFAQLPFERVSQGGSVREAMRRALARGVSSVIEIVTDWRRTASALAARRELVRGVVEVVAGGESNGIAPS
jgi:2-succinyl-5-enolpyruvyl-6-hydroxy-3-cyclohexene-1-carboxylate synthase